MTSALRTLALATLFVGNVTFLTADTTEQAAALHKIFQDIKTLNKGACLSSQIAMLDAENNFTEEELLALCEAAKKQFCEFDDVVESKSYEQFQAITKTLVSQLKEYKISGAGFAVHPSWSFFYGPQNFNAALVFKNSKGEARSRIVNLKYESIGIQGDLAWRIDYIFAVGTDLSFFSTKTPLEFDLGATCAAHLLPIFALAGSDLGVSILPFKNAKGSLVIVHGGPGLHFPAGIAVITSGGTMTPQATK